MWEIYDDLINNIPENLKAEEIIVGHEWTLVRSGNSCGLGAIEPVKTRLPIFSGNLIGRTLKEVAGCIKSWNFVEASIGMAAINAFYNSIDNLMKNGIELPRSNYADDRLKDPFITYQQEIKGKNVSVIGHFPYLETLFAPVCNLTIIETDPLEGDYPFYACEYFLPEQDYVFITCGSLINKTLPRLLEISKGAKRIMVGPATPMAPQLFTYGIHDLSGFVVKDMTMIIRIVSGAQVGSMYSTGNKVNLKRDIE